jgi:hypothetical protein
LLRFNQTVKEHLTMKNRNSIHWLAPVTAVALVLASLTIASQGPLPYVHHHLVHVAPAWAWPDHSMAREAEHAAHGHVVIVPEPAHSG